MRAYLRTSRRTGISMPLWLAPLVALAWLTILVAYWFGMLIVASGMLAVRGARWCWRRAHQR